MASKPLRQPNVQLVVVADLGADHAAADVALFLYDFVSLYEIARLALDPAYRAYRFSRFSLYRNGRPLAAEDRMLVEKIRLRSPLEVVATIAASGAAAASVAGAIWTLVQAIERLYNLRLNREKLELEVRKLRREEIQARFPWDLPEDRAEPPALLRKRGAAPYVEALERRLTSSPVKITRFEVAVTVSEEAASRRRARRPTKGRGG